MMRSLRQDSRGRRYLLIPALIGYQAVQNLLPNALLVLGGDALNINCTSRGDREFN